MSNFQLASTTLNTAYGEYEFHCFAFGPHEEDQILCLRNPSSAEPTLVRVQSACYTAEIFRSKDCDCHEQLHQSLERITKEGGLLIYMLCDGRGAGLYKKVLGLELGRTQGLDTADAYRELGLEQDPRRYERANEVLKHFNISNVRLLTNNPRKVAGLEQGGIRVSREPIEIQPTTDSLPYLSTKKLKMGHWLELNEDTAT
jgi:GTP cyclohydrolase II